MIVLRRFGAGRQAVRIGAASRLSWNASTGTRWLSGGLSEENKVPEGNVSAEGAGAAGKLRKKTSLLNSTARSFGNSLKLEIIDKKYTDEGKLLSLDITDRAVSKLSELIKEENNPDLALRITVESGGCHGFQYNLNLTDVSTKQPQDCLFKKGEAKVLIDESSLSILRESKIDYTNELIGSMFKVVDSPYTTSSCGCGSSFDFDFSKLGT